jgi:hypothetical protein
MSTSKKFVDQLDGSEYIVIDYGNGQFESFLMDENNPRYQQWLAEGNTPELWNPEA